MDKTATSVTESSLSYIRGNEAMSDSRSVVSRWYREIFGAVPDAGDLSTYAGSLDQALSGTNGPTVTAVQNVLINFLEQAPPNPMLEQVYGGPLSQNPDGGNDHRRLMI
jgi:hypothetical protein